MNDQGKQLALSPAEILYGVRFPRYGLMSRGARYHGGLFLRRYGKQHGRDWLRRVSAEDRQVFSTLGREHLPENIHHLGGTARAQTAKRDTRGRFMKKEVSDERAGLVQLADQK